MVDSQAVEQGGVEVVEAHGVTHDVVGKVIRLAVNYARLHASTRQPYAEAARVMVAAIVGPSEGALRIHGAAKLAGPHHQRVVKESALLEVRHERVAGLIGVEALEAMISGQVAVLIPAAMQDLYDPNIALGHASGEQAARGK